MKPRILCIGDEKWVEMDILGRKYAVSDKAGFKRLKQEIVGTDGVVKRYTERAVKPIINGQGRADVKVNRTTLRLAHLVAKAFIGERPSGFVVSHKDGDKTNDHASNLEYISTSRNVLNIADGVRCDNTTGIRGVYYDIHGSNPIWRGRIVVDRRGFSFASREKMKVVAWRKIMELLYKADRRVA